tara:strand:- start:191 stop:367 length:177 start_codon:yes stop_codon:yes gene_type:complete
MTQQEALESLIRAVKVAQQRGTYSLEEASVVHSAVEVFTTPDSKPEEPVEKSEKKKKS